MFSGDKCGSPTQQFVMLQETVACENESSDTFSSRLGPEHAAVWLALVVTWVVVVFGALFLGRECKSGARLSPTVIHAASTVTAALGLFLAFVTCNDEVLSGFFAMAPPRHAPGKMPHCNAVDLQSATSCGAYFQWVSSGLVDPAERALSAVAAAILPGVGAGYAGFVVVALLIGFVADFCVRVIPLLALVLFIGCYVTYILCVDMILQLCANSDAAALLVPLRFFFFAVLTVFGTRHTAAATGVFSPATIFITLYSLILVEVCAKGTTLAVIRPRYFWPVGASAMMFLLSDLAISAMMFAKRERFGLWPLSRLHIRDVVWGTYLFAQLLMAVSIVSAHSFIGTTTS